MSLPVDLGNLPLLLDEASAILTLPPVSDDEFYAFCQRNPLLNVERTAGGTLHFMPPVTAWVDSRGLELAGDLLIWNRALATPGYTFGPTAGFKLPNGAIRSPDVSWVPRERWDALPEAERFPYPHLCPDFVAEVMSPSDRLSDSQEKMEEYRENGARLGWLLDLKNRIVYVYRPGVNEPEALHDPATISGDPVLPGLVVELTRIFA